MSPQLERAYRNRMSLPPAERAAVEEAYAAALAEHEVRMGNRSPADLDPADAAAAPIIIDPAPGPRAGPERKRSRADWAADAATAGAMYAPSEIVDAMDVAAPPTRRALDEAMGLPANGLPPGYEDYARAMTDAETGTTREERQAMIEETSRRIDAQAAAYNRATGMPQPSGLAENDGYRDWSGWAPGQPLPDARSDFDGVMANRAQAEADRDARMQPMLDADRRDTKARAQWRADNPAAAENLAVNQRSRADDYRKERLLYRMAEQTGMSVEELRAANPEFASVGHRTVGGGIPTLTRTKDGMQMRDMPTSTSSMRDAAAQNRISEAQARKKAWRSQMMLAGNNPRKNAVNAWNALGEEGLNDWQRLTMAKALRPDIDGTTPLTADAAGAKNAMRFVTADMLGQGMLGDTREAVMRQKSRDDAVARANELAQKYVGWDGQIDQSDAEVIRRRVEAQYPGMGDAAYNSLPIRQSRPPAPATPPNPTGGAI